MVQQEIGSSEKGSAVRNVLSKISAENVKQCFISDDLPIQFICNGNVYFKNFNYIITLIIMMKDKCRLPELILLVMNGWKQRIHCVKYQGIAL